MPIKPDLVRAGLALVAACSVAAWTSPAIAQVQRSTLDAEAFLDTVGVNVHMAYTDGAYAKVAKVREALRYAGIRHIRDVMPADDHVPGRHGRQALSFLGRDGHGLAIVMPPTWSIENAIKFLVYLETTAPGALTAVESYNEINNFPARFEGESSLEAAERGQQALYAAVKSHPELKHLPVYDMTGQEILRKNAGVDTSEGDDLEGRADVANIHPYPQNGSQPGGWIRMDKIGAYGLDPSHPKVITEFGYASLPQSGWQVIGVDDRTQAKGILNGLFDAARAGFERTYVYELLDQKPDPEQNKLQRHFGLFTVAYEPKPIAVALRSIRGLLTEHASTGAAGVAPPELDDAATEGQDGVRAIDLRTAGDTLVTALWREQPFWDRATGEPIVSPPIDVTVTFGSACAEIRMAAPLDDTTWTVVATETAQAAIPVSDAPVLVQCG